MPNWTRRSVLAGMLSVGGGAAFAQQGGLAPTSADQIIAASKMSGDIAYAVIDTRSGTLVEARNPNQVMPVASTVKTITALYALETLGPDYRFETRLIATGPVTAGVLQGDLILAGGGDPTLSTDDLADLVQALKQAGVRSVTGRFLVWGRALPQTDQIANDQPIFAGYNPGVSGLNLNYNRVYVEWARKQGNYALRVDARGKRYNPAVSSTVVSVANRAGPAFDYNKRQDKEQWSIATGAMAKPGSVWLPVRDPETYAGDVFRTLAAGQGLQLPKAEKTTNLRGTAMVAHRSLTLREIVQDMLYYSTNLTAETVGLAASMVRGEAGGQQASGVAMRSWLSDLVGNTQARFADHSGLNDGTRSSPLDMARAVAILGRKDGLRPLLKPFALRDDRGRQYDGAFRVDAKTGTLNYVSTLAGYINAPGHGELVFALFTGDPTQRDRWRGQVEAPGSRAWVQHSKMLQSRLLERWATVYG